MRTKGNLKRIQELLWKEADSSQGNTRIILTRMAQLFDCALNNEDCDVNNIIQHIKLLQK